MYGEYDMKKTTVLIDERLLTEAMTDAIVVHADSHFDLMSSHVALRVESFVKATKKFKIALTSKKRQEAGRLGGDKAEIQNS